MAIEHRLTHRYPASPVVYIRYRDRCLRPALGSNLSKHGMFVSTRDFQFPTGTLVHVEFAENARGRLIPALVAHGSEAGVGLDFLEELSPALWDSGTQLSADAA